LAGNALFVLEMEIILLGLNHKTAAIEIRERVCLPQERAKDFLGDVVGLSGVQEGMVLSTCNRMEILVVVEGEEDPTAKIIGLLSTLAGMSTQEFASYLYIHRGEEAVRHLLRVTASLDSMVLGEPQILGQVKAAYAQAVQMKSSGLILNKLLHRSFTVAKRVRTETKIASQAVSVSFAAVELAKKILGSLEDKRVMLIGAGEMSELAARHFMSQGVKEILVTNRTHSRALELAEEFRGEAVPFEDFPKQLKKVDIVLSSTGSSQPIIRREQLNDVLRARKNRPMFFIDIAVPRDIDPRINEMANVFVYDIDDLQGIVVANQEDRKREVDKGEEMVEYGVEVFNRWLKSLDVVPTILDLRHRLEKIRRRELDKALALCKDASEEERKTMDLLTQAIINKILHHPVTLLKHQESRGQGALYVEMTRKIFQLDEEDNGPAAS
jgi:glutamyl-tRNA reductase